MLSLNAKHDGHVFHVLYLLGFFFALHMALPEYIASSFIARVSAERWVGIFYAVASFLTILALTTMPTLLARFGNYRVLIGAMGLQILALAGLAQEWGSIPTLSLFLVYFTMPVIIFFCMDIILESNSSNEKTGRLRGGYFTILNLAWVVSPFIVSLVLTDSDYWKVFIVSAAMITLAGALALLHFRGFKDPVYVRVPFWNTFARVMRERDIRGVFFSNILLQFFYSWMIIYTPIYLHAHVGFSWNEIGIMFGIMLLPFILFELPAGRLADKRYGERGILAIGFVIMAVATLTLFFIKDAEFVLWTVALFVTRIGAALVEIMNETHLFKYIDGRETGVLSFFRGTRPIAYLIAPVLGTVFLFFVPYHTLFVILSCVTAVGVFVALTLSDKNGSHTSVPAFPKGTTPGTGTPKTAPMA